MEKTLFHITAAKEKTAGYKRPGSEAQNDRHVETTLEMRHHQSGASAEGHGDSTGSHRPLPYQGH